MNALTANSTVAATAAGSGRERTRIAFLIRSLNRGGTERQLVELIRNLDAAQFEIAVLTFYSGGPIWEELAAIGSVELQSLGKRNRWEVVRFALRLSRWLRDWKPEIVHCFNVEPSLFGLIVGRWCGVGAVVWGIRASNVNFSLVNRFGWVTFRLAARLSRFASLMIANSETGRSYHVAQGYHSDAFTVIPNGIDTDRYAPNDDLRSAVRKTWAIDEDVVVVGIVARLDPIKDHPTLLHAARKVVEQHRNVRFVCVGGGDARMATALSRLVSRLGLDRFVLFVGEHSSPEGLYPAFDVACSTSLTEGFSNSIAEALSCGVPCVATDVGDSARIVGDAGIIVPPQDVDALAAALVRLVAMPPAHRQALGDAGRRRMIEEFSVGRMTARTVDAYAAVLNGRSPQWT